MGCLKLNNEYFFKSSVVSSQLSVKHIQFLANSAILRNFQLSNLPFPAKQCYTDFGTKNVFEDYAIDYDYDLFGLRTQLQLKENTTPISTVDYTYDGGSRLETITNGAISATFTRVLGSNLIKTIEYKNGSDVILTATREYDTLNRLTSISSISALSVKSVFYSYNNADKRIKTTLADNSYWIYEYDELGQVTSGKKYLSSGVKIEGQQFGYNYDDIGNRKTETRAMDDIMYSYVSNDLNQYTSRIIPNKIPVTGFSAEDANVRIHRKDKGMIPSAFINPERKGTQFFAKIVVDNSSSDVEENIDIFATKFDEVKDKDIIAKQSGKISLPMTPQAINYDDDGNMLSDNKWNYAYNAENRVISAESATIKLEFTYDYAGRRVSKKVYNWDTVTADWLLLTDNCFVWNGNYIIAKFADDTLNKTYFRTGSRVIAETNSNGTFYAQYDGNKNIVGYISSVDGASSADYEYSPFGRTISKSGSLADEFDFTFSSEYYDRDTNSMAYKHRDYDLDLARWRTRDPIGINGGTNIYGNGNDFVNYTDKFGLKAYLVYRKMAIPILGKTHSDLKGILSFKMTGHVYLAFDNKGANGEESKTLKDFFKKLRTLDENFKKNPKGGYHTFSFHPWSVRHPNETSGDRISVAVTDSSDVFYYDEKNDVLPIIHNLATKWEITSTPQEQCKLLTNVAKSWQINSKSSGSNDFGNYSFLVNNCGSWALRMIKNSALEVPGEALNLGTALGYGMDKTGIPQAAYYLGRGLVDLSDHVDDTIDDTIDDIIDDAKDFIDDLQYKYGRKWWEVY